MSDQLRWYKVCCDEIIPGFEFEPEFAHDQLMSLLVHDEEYNTQDVYQLDLDAQTALQLTRFSLDGATYFNLELLCNSTPCAVITYAAGDVDMLRSSGGRALAPYLSRVLPSQGIPQCYLDTLQIALRNPDIAYKRDPSLEYRLIG